MHKIDGQASVYS